MTTLNMQASLLSTLSKPISNNLAILLLRLWTGGMMMFHGYSKVFQDNSNFISYLSKIGLPIPAVMASLAGGSEFFGGLFILVGFLTRPASLSVLLTMLVAGFWAHRSNIIGDGEQALTYAVLSLVLIFSGSGKWSLDSYLLKDR